MNNPPRVYLAGPIAGMNKEQANDWREVVTVSLAESGIVAVSPLRKEPIVGETYNLAYDDLLYGTAEAIASKNEFDVHSCDWVIAYMPKWASNVRPSYGTTIEVGLAYAFNKPVVLVSDDPAITEHPLFKRCSKWILPSLELAVELTVGTLSVYSNYDQAKIRG